MRSIYNLYILIKLLSQNGTVTTMRSTIRSRNQSIEPQVLIGVLMAATLLLSYY